jgi:hypothetical protein
MHQNRRHYLLLLNRSSSRQLISSPHTLLAIYKTNKLKKLKKILALLVSATLLVCTSKTDTTEREVIGFEQSEETNTNRVNLYAGNAAGV